MGVDGDTGTSKCTAEAQPAGTGGKLMKEAVASDTGDQDCELYSNDEEIRTPWEEDGGMLRLRKEVKAAWDHWFLTCRKLRKVKPQEDEAQAPGLEATQQEKAAQAPGGGAGKKTKVVKFKMRKEKVEQMRACPFSILADYSDEELAQSTPYWREMYAAGRFLEAKNHEYWNALIAQQDELGYAEDEKEVTDDEEEEVVKSS